MNIEENWMLGLFFTGDLKVHSVKLDRTQLHQFLEAVIVIEAHLLHRYVVGCRSVFEFLLLGFGKELLKYLFLQHVLLRLG